MPKKKTTEQFIEEARAVHGDKYDYSLVNYVDNSTKVSIICPIHGEFLQQPNNHLNGNGCPECKKDRLKKLKLSNKNKFIEEACKVHGDKYDYSKVEYINNHTNVCIICPEHGEFWQRPNNHLNGNGCPVCSKESIKIKHNDTTESFIEKARAVHGDKYDYSKVNYVNSSTKVCIICPEHGEFWQRPNNHLNGWGCKKCGYILVSNKTKMDKNVFIEKANIIHNNKYDYSKVNYINSKTNVTIICPEHGEFNQKPEKHLVGHGCQKCGISNPSTEQKIFEYINNVLHCEQQIRNIIPPQELDIYIPSKQIAIEYNGLFWHSETCGKDKNYHLNKLKACKKKGIGLIQIFEDEYVNHKELVIEKINHILNIHQENKEKIPARKCVIKEISVSIAENFLYTYHIQGFVGGTTYLGAYYNDTLIGVMTFKQQVTNSDKWELTRFASDYHYICQGVGGKLFSYFVKNYNPNEVKSFADRRWTISETDNLYIKLGFEFDKYTYPDYRYFNYSDGVVRQHKFGFRKQILHKKYGLDLSMTEDEMTKELGYVRIWDCGLIRYIWRNKNESTSKETDSRNT